MDAADPIGHFRDRFHIPNPDVVYLDGNSLGMPPKRTLERMTEIFEQDWATGLIRSWDHWVDMPQRVGDVLAPNREIATMLLPNPLWVRVFVPEPWLGHIKAGDKVTVETDAFPKQPFQGTVVQLARAAEFTPRNVQTVEERIKQVFGVKIGLKNESDKLRAGMSVDVVFPNVVK